jgi:hypothetical protein
MMVPAPTRPATARAWDLKGFIEDAGNRNHIDVDPKLGSVAWGAARHRRPPPTRRRSVMVARSRALEATDYIGAVKDAGSDWTKGWTNYAPN